MIDLYKQSEHQRNSLRHYTPVHLAALLSTIILSLSFISPPRPMESKFTMADIDPPVPAGQGLDSPIFIAQDLRLDPAKPPGDKLFWSSTPESELVEELLSSMSDEELISQLFLLGWVSERAEGPIMDWISKRAVGGVKVFGWNGKNLATLSQALTEMQKSALETEYGIPLFTATDQEGGWVRHIKDATSITPGNMAIGASALPMDSYLSGYYIGRELRAIGINMNFAPAVDVYVNNQAHVIGPRAFSANPRETAVLGLAFFHGMQEAGIIATAKHFPGHGNAQGDSHGYLPVIEDDFDTVWQRDLLPYRVMIPEGLPAVLSAHLSFPNITGNNRPASLDSYFKNKVLREALNFQGIIITDDLYMGGAMSYGDGEGWDMARIVLEAVRVGNDMVMLSETPAINDRIWNLIVEEYQTSPTFRERVLESVGRILRIKLRYLKPEWRVPLELNTRHVYEDLKKNHSQPFFQEQAARGITLIKGDNIPYTNANGERILLAGQDGDFIREGSKNYPGSGTYYFSYLPFYSAEQQVIDDLRRLIPAYDRVIFNLVNPNSFEVLQSLRSFADKIIVISTLTPIYLEDAPWVRSAIAVYGRGVESFSAGFAAMKGEIPFRGNLPVSISPSLAPGTSRDDSPNAQSPNPAQE